MISVLKSVLVTRTPPLLSPLTIAKTLIPVRTSVWPPAYVDPTFEKGKLEEVKRDESKLNELKFLPVKAALNNQSSSVYYEENLNFWLEVMLMREGKKQLTHQLINETMYEIKKTQLAKYRAAKTDAERDSIELDPTKIILTAIENCRPVLVAKSMKRGGATYQVPYAISRRESLKLSIRWLINVAKERPKPRKDHFPPVFAREILDAFNCEGKVWKKKMDMHVLCEANKAYAHYRWS